MGFSLPRSMSAINASSTVGLTRASTTSIVTSAWLIASSDCLLTLSSIPFSLFDLGNHPPVSISVNSHPAHVTSNSFRSLVTPGRSSTMASLFPMIRFTSVDFPTFGLPTTATVGLFMTNSKGFLERYSIGSYDFNLAWKVTGLHTI